MKTFADVWAAAEARFPGLTFSVDVTGWRRIRDRRNGRVATADVTWTVYWVDEKGISHDQEAGSAEEMVAILRGATQPSATPEAVGVIELPCNADSKGCTAGTDPDTHELGPCSKCRQAMALSREDALGRAS